MKKLLLLTSVGIAFAENIDSNDQPETVSEPIIVTASRLPELLSNTKNSVDLISAETRENRQQFRLQDAIQISPGIISTSTAGQEGQTGTLIIQGLPTRYNQLLIDGVRVSEAAVSGGSIGNLFGNFEFGPQEQLEIARGAQGVVHGSAAIGGVVGIRNDFSQNSPEISLSQEVGSNDYTRSQVSSNGKIEDLAYYFNATHTNFDQDLPVENRDEVTNTQVSLGAEYSVDDNFAVRLTARGGQTELEDEFLLIENDFNLFSLQFLYDDKSAYSNALVIGYFEEDFNFDQFFETQYEKWSFTFDNNYQHSENLSLNFGLDNAFSDFNNNGSQSDWYSVGAYTNLRFKYNDFSFDIGGRGEFHSENEFTYSAEALATYDFSDYDSSAYLKVASGFRTPSYLETDAFPPAPFPGSLPQIANDNLEAERVLTLESGLRKNLFEQSEIAINGYAHFFNNALSSTFSSEGTQFQNLDGRSEIFGLNTYFKGKIYENINYTVAWNYTLKNEVEDVPRNTVNADLHYDADKWLIGLGLSHRSGATFGGPNRLDSFLTARVYGHYNILDELRVNFRVENAFDEQYEVNPFSASSVLGRGTAFFIGAQLTF